MKCPDFFSRDKLVLLFYKRYGWVTTTKQASKNAMHLIVYKIKDNYEGLSAVQDQSQTYLTRILLMQKNSHIQNYMLNASIDMLIILHMKYMHTNDFFRVGLHLKV